jgi:hypothetical protein
VLDYILLYYISGIVDVELVCTKVLVPTTEVLSHLKDIVKGKGKVTPKQAYVALRGPGGKGFRISRQLAH